MGQRHTSPPDRGGVQNAGGYLMLEKLRVMSIVIQCGGYLYYFRREGKQLCLEKAIQNRSVAVFEREIPGITATIEVVPDQCQTPDLPGDSDEMTATPASGIWNFISAFAPISGSTVRIEIGPREGSPSRARAHQSRSKTPWTKE
jgi:hypothetical protein